MTIRHHGFRHAVMLGALGLTTAAGVNTLTAASASADTGVTIPIPGCPVHIDLTYKLPGPTSSDSCTPLGLGPGENPYGIVPIHIPGPKSVL